MAADDVERPELDLPGWLRPYLIVAMLAGAMWIVEVIDTIPSVDLDLVKTSVGIAAEVGGNLAEVFDRIAFTIRERRRIEGRIDSLTAQGKIQGLMVALIPILMMVAINFIDENMLTPLFTTVYGYVTLGVMAIMEGLGYFLVRKITTIEV